MKNKKYLLAALLLPSILLSRNEYGLNEKNEAGKLQIQTINELRLKPYNEDLQNKILSLYGKEIDYTKRTQTYNVLKIVHLNSSKPQVKDLVLDKLENHEFPKEKIKVDRTTKRKIVKKINTEVSERKFKQTKKKSKDSFSEVLLLDSLGYKKEAEELYLSKKDKKINDLNEIFYKLRYMTLHENFIDARNLFQEKIDKKHNKRWEKSKTMRLPKDKETVSSKIYALAALFETEENKKRIHKMFDFMPGAKDLYYYYAYEKNFKNENFSEALMYLNEIKNNMSEKNFEIKSINLYKKYTLKKLINRNYAESWNAARSGLYLIKNSKKKVEHKSPGILLKRTLLKVSSRYVQELANKGEYSHSRRIQKETSNLMKIKLF